MFANFWVPPASLSSFPTVQPAALDDPPASVNYFTPTSPDALAIRDHSTQDSPVHSLESVGQDLSRPQQQIEHTVDPLAGPESQTPR